jgi:hypothetical protein
MGKQARHAAQKMKHALSFQKKQGSSLLELRKTFIFNTLGESALYSFTL